MAERVAGSSQKRAVKRTKSVAGKRAAKSAQPAKLAKPAKTAVAAAKTNGGSKAASGLKRQLQQSEARNTALQTEVDQLQSDLGEAKDLIGDLERRQKDALNRIDWAIDSLHTLLEDER